MKNFLFNEYLIFADESGDHLLRPHYPEFPVFILAFCIIKRDHYANYVVPELVRIKLKYFQDSHIIFHELDIRKASGVFGFLTNEEFRESFFKELNKFFNNAEFNVIASVIRKDHLQNIYDDPANPYSIGTAFCIERLLMFLNRRNQTLKTTITFESRGKKEDKDLELKCLRLSKTIYHNRFDIKILPKLSNCAGLQLAKRIPC